MLYFIRLPLSTLFSLATRSRCGVTAAAEVQADGEQLPHVNNFVDSLLHYSSNDVWSRAYSDSKVSCVVVERRLLCSRSYRVSTSIAVKLLLAIVGFSHLLLPDRTRLARRVLCRQSTHRSGARQCANRRHNSAPTLCRSDSVQNSTASVAKCPDGHFDLPNPLTEPTQTRYFASRGVINDHVQLATLVELARRQPPSRRSPQTSATA